MFASPVLVVAAHTDDEVLGCGATLHRLVQAGEEVVVNWLGYGLGPRTPEHEINPQRLQRDAAKREAPIANAMKRLGVEYFTRLLQLPATKFDLTSVAELTAAIEASIKLVQPRTVLTHWWGDVNQDHQQTFRAVEIAVRMQPQQVVRTVACFEILSSTDYVLRDAFHPTLFVRVSTADITAKIAAMRAYATEVRPAPHPRSPYGIRIQAARRGMQIGVGWAEGFVLARGVLA